MSDIRAQLASLKSKTDTIGADGNPESPITVATWITLAGYGAGLWWIAGGPPWAAIASILADEVDGVVARERGEITEYGSTFDWSADVILAALTLRKLGAPLWTIPTATMGQVWLREQNYRPAIGSLRAALMLYGVIKEGYDKRSIHQ